MTIEVRSELPITEKTFDSRFKPFETSTPLEENIVLCHRFTPLPETVVVDPEKRIYFRAPWAIYNTGEQYIYQWISAEPPYKNYYRTMVTDRQHSFLDIYNDSDMAEKFMAGGLTSLTMFPTDQILLGRLLAYRKGCIMHSLGISLNNSGYLFVGHSGAGKSTMAGLIKEHAVILCDDRNIIREYNGGYILSGTWSHGDVPDVDGRDVPLKAVFFLEKSDTNHLDPVQDPRIVFERLLACVIRPLETRDWWDGTLEFLARISGRVPCWNLKFDKTGKIIDLIKGI